jgi:hypothetical protein
MTAANLDVRPAIAPSTTNFVLQFALEAKPVSAQRLVCHWHRDADGRLVCAWESDISPRSRILDPNEPAEPFMSGGDNVGH